LEQLNNGTSPLLKGYPGPQIYGVGMNEKDTRYYQFMTDTLNSFDVEHVGVVYILGSSLGYYKIGLTTNLYKRFTNFGVKLPFEVWLEHAKIYFDCGWAEKYWHYQFQDKRINGEWFKINEFDLDKFHYTPSDTSADAKLNCLYANSNTKLWESDDVRFLLEDYNMKVAYRKAVIQDYLTFQLSQPHIDRHYLVRKQAKFDALTVSSTSLDTLPRKES
jgi:hypothetical protein